MLAFPPCKLNLGLHVTHKRMDGYHDIETCFYPVPFTDVLEVVVSDQFAFSSTGVVVPGPVENNLCVKAFELLKHDHDLAPVQIHLHKIIPTGAGLGGGSSDAAYTLRLLNQVFDLNLSLDQLMQYAAKLGSDCAFFIGDKPMIGKGRGELLHDINLSLKGKYVVLIKPDLEVSTAAAYAGITPDTPAMPIAEILTQHPMSHWKEMLVNDFEVSVFQKFPILKHIKESLYDAGAVYACMSGSGSTVFGIFDTAVQPATDYPVMWSGYLQ
ncbi:MAG TPA: 4-(cytidine 5'-diphospho)-2-C-methyl-D-erythritol kinase [Ohtaekwangia sp.]|nr:4-(cytidine 5'-diphospho)-2-C-methyl-D-erythritol kinase [Ohtaekwangia sp.]